MHMNAMKINFRLPALLSLFAAVALAPSIYAQTTPSPATNAPAALTLGKDGVPIADFAKLAGFSYIVSDTPLTNQLFGADVSDKQIPADVKALSTKKVTITGYMMPLKEQGDKATEFLIMRTQSSCCYGVAPAITELITVKAPGEGVPTIMDDLVQVQGTLKVGTVREDGYIVGIYQMDDGKFLGRANK
jgi:hypothetical protein